MLMLLPVVSLIIGLVVLTYSANYFTDGCMSLAKNLNVSSLSVGVFVLGFGTSAPEIIISAWSAFKGLPGLAVGNVVGSNIANIGLVVGIATIIYPIKVSKQVLMFETSLMIGVTFVAFTIMVWDSKLDYVDGWILFLLLITVMGIFYYQKKQTKNTQAEENLAIHPMSLSKSVIITFGSLVALLISAKILVWGASEIAIHFGISNTLVGLTIVAIGTSLPELAAAISASLKKQTNLILGNIIGSNLFNLLAVLPFPAFMIGFNLPQRLVLFDLIVMFALALLIPIIVLLSKQKQIGRVSGILLLFIYLFYLIALIVLTSNS